MEYRYETHCHTSPVSRCAGATPEETVRFYDKLGYSGLVLTEHYSLTTFRKMLPSPQKHLDFYLSTYRAMKAFAGDSFAVLPGLELRYFYSINDYLIYGADEKWILSQGNLLLSNPKQTYEATRGEGILIVQAHPYRKYMTRCNPDYLDGIEVFNGKTDFESNEKARLRAEQYGKIQLSGSDCHREKQAGRGGIITTSPILTPSDLTAVLTGGNYQLIKNQI